MAKSKTEKPSEYNGWCLVLRNSRGSCIMRAYALDYSLLCFFREHFDGSTLFCCTISPCVLHFVHFSSLNKYPDRVVWLGPDRVNADVSSDYIVA